MQVTNTSWQFAGSGSASKAIIQNVGYNAIAFVIAASPPPEAPTAGFITLDVGEHGILQPGMDPIILTDLTGPAMNMYVRSLGPTNGALYVWSA